jgi:hypothetical protein
MRLRFDCVKTRPIRAVLDDALRGSDYVLHFAEEVGAVDVTFIRKRTYDRRLKWFNQLEREGQLTSDGILAILKKRGLEFSSHFSVYVARGDPFADEGEQQGGALLWVTIRGEDADFERFHRFLGN